jgi:hypothetical protein
MLQAVSIVMEEQFASLQTKIRSGELTSSRIGMLNLEEDDQKLLPFEASSRMQTTAIDSSVTWELFATIMGKKVELAAESIVKSKWRFRSSANFDEIIFEQSSTLGPINFSSSQGRIVVYGPAIDADSYRSIIDADDIKLIVQGSNDSERLYMLRIAS